ncbi:spirocyclase AveC family protein [Mycobacterium syngnathidarum]
MAFEAYVLIKWVTGPYFERVPGGPNEPDMFIKVATTVVTAIGVPLMLLAIWHWVVRPWRRSRVVTPEGLMCIWLLTFGWFYDPLINWFYPYYSFNSWLPNRGSWVADIPGWVSITAGHPGAMEAYPLGILVPAYAWVFLTINVSLAWFMRKLRAKYPNMSTPVLIVLAYIPAYIFFMLGEMIFMRVGAWGYHAAVPELTFFYGNYYQMPIYHPMFTGALALAYASLLYFRNDKGQTIVERGIDKVKAGTIGTIALRFAAMASMCAAIFMCVFNIPYAILVAIQHEPWPQYAQEKSYWTNHFCGDGTDQACPSPDLPIATRNSGHFDPHGKYILPPNGKTPAQSDQFPEFAK